tara:strand:+ start:59 stop:445 length:387 start_codon:yes stop_codon:yes gene_type:complete
VPGEPDTPVSDLADVFFFEVSEHGGKVLAVIVAKSVLTVDSAIVPVLFRATQALDPSVCRVGKSSEFQTVIDLVKQSEISPRSIHNEKLDLSNRVRVNDSTLDDSQFILIFTDEKSFTLDLDNQRSAI